MDDLGVLVFQEMLKFVHRTTMVTLTVLDNIAMDITIVI